MKSIDPLDTFMPPIERIAIPQKTQKHTTVVNVQQPSHTEMSMSFTWTTFIRFPLLDNSQVTCD